MKIQHTAPSNSEFMMRWLEENFSKFNFPSTFQFSFHHHAPWYDTPQMDVLRRGIVASSSPTQTLKASLKRKKKWKIIFSHLDMIHEHMQAKFKDDLSLCLRRHSSGRKLWKLLHLIQPMISRTVPDTLSPPHHFDCSFNCFAFFSICEIPSKQCTQSNDVQGWKRTFHAKLFSRTWTENAKFSFLFAHSIELEAVEKRFGVKCSCWWRCGLRKMQITSTLCAVSCSYVNRLSG